MSEPTVEQVALDVADLEQRVEAIESTIPAPPEPEPVSEVLGGSPGLPASEIPAVMRARFRLADERPADADEPDQPTGGGGDE